MPTLTAWPFDQPRHCAVVTLRQIMDGSEPILRVYHDMEDDGWQFLGRRDGRTEDAMSVTLHEVVSKDDSLFELADMPPGWHAWRKSVNEPWTRAANPGNYE